MRAAWDWSLPRETETQERRLVDFAADCGFDTLIVGGPTPAMVDHGHDRNVRLVDVIHPYPDESLENEHPDCLQAVLDAEDAIADAVADAPEDYLRLAHRWYPILQTADPLCYESEPAMAFLESRVSEALETADGVAFDAFGYKNHYACHCDRCAGRRREYRERNDVRRIEALARVSEEILVEASSRLYDHAKAVDSDAVVTNHVWPPFRPNPEYGRRLRLDYCSQTISWFYRPNRPLDRVEFEAERHAELEGDANAFAPFIGVFDDPALLRGPDRLARELEIALEYGDGNLVFCTLAAPYAHEEIEAVLREALA